MDMGYYKHRSYFDKRDKIRSGAAVVVGYIEAFLASGSVYNLVAGDNHHTAEFAVAAADNFDSGGNTYIALIVPVVVPVPEVVMGMVFGEIADIVLRVVSFLHPIRMSLSLYAPFFSVS